MLNAIALLLIVSAQAVAQGEQTKTTKPEQKEMPPTVKRYFEEAELQQKAAIEDMEQRIKDRTAAARKNPAKGEQAKKQGQELAAMRKSLGSLKKNDPPFVPAINVLKIKLGDVGRLDCGGDVKTLALPDSRGVHVIGGQTATTLWIIAITGPKEFVAEPFYYTNRTADNPGRKVRIRPLIIRGIETESLVTDRAVELGHVFYISGTTRYGADQVFVAEVLDVEPWIVK